MRERLVWIRRDPEHYRPQPYDQLLAAYKLAGEEQNARRVGLERERRRRATLPIPARLVSFIQEVTVGYGYRSWLAAAWLVVLTAVSAVAFSIYPPRAKGDAGRIEPAVYALDLLLPIVNLGQSDNFTASGGTRWLVWTLTLLGWVLTTAVVAGLTRLLNRT